MWPNTELQDLLGIQHPIIQAPMAAASDSKMAIAVAKTGGLGSIPCGMLDIETMRAEIQAFQQQTNSPLNVNFFCHKMPNKNANIDNHWKANLAPYYKELNICPPRGVPAVDRLPFDDVTCEVLEEFKPKIVSFHFGLPSKNLLNRVKATGAKILGCATTIEEALSLEERGCDAIIAQGYEAGGHRGMFLSDNINTQVGTLTLILQITNAVNIPVIAAGGISNGRSVAASLQLGAAGVQIGTAFLLSPESLISPLHREAIKSNGFKSTEVTNLISGKPARGIVNRLMRENSPISNKVPEFPHAGKALAPLKEAAEAQGNTDFSPLWAGQGHAFCQEKSSFEIMQIIIKETIYQLQSINIKMR